MDAPKVRYGAARNSVAMAQSPVGRWLNLASAPRFPETWYDLSRALERVHYKSPWSLDEVEVQASEGIGVFCSQLCLDAGREAVMNASGVPIPAVRPGIGPVESCAKCARPVDMSDWHLTYTDGCLEEKGDEVRVIAVDYVAVVCRDCAPDGQYEESAEHSEIVDGEHPVTIEPLVERGAGAAKEAKVVARERQAYAA